MPKTQHTIKVTETVARRAAQALMDMAVGVEQVTGLPKQETRQHADAQTIYKALREARSIRKGNASTSAVYHSEDYGRDLDESH